MRLNVNRETTFIGIALALAAVGVANGAQAQAMYAGDGTVPTPENWLKILGPFAAAVVSWILSKWPQGQNPLIRALVDLLSQQIGQAPLASIDVVATRTDGSVAKTHVDLLPPAPAEAKR